MSISLNVSASQRVKPGASGYPLHAVVVGGQRFWGHIRAYGIIAGIMLLALLSLVALQFHWLARTFSVAVYRRSIAPDFKTTTEDEANATEASFLPRP
jgi:hypothetical protein